MSGDVGRLAAVLDKPLRPIWLSQESRMWLNEMADHADLPFTPLYLVSASRPQPERQSIGRPLRQVAFTGVIVVKASHSDYSYHHHIHVLTSGFARHVTDCVFVALHYVTGPVECTAFATALFAASSVPPKNLVEGRVLSHCLNSECIGSIMQLACNGGNLSVLGAPPEYTGGQTSMPGPEHSLSALAAPPD